MRPFYIITYTYIQVFPFSISPNFTDSSCQLVKLRLPLVLNFTAGMFEKKGRGGCNDRRDLLTVSPSHNPSSGNDGSLNWLTVTG